MAYIAPTIVRYGSVATLTATSIKCSPGVDATFADNPEQQWDLLPDGTWFNQVTGGTMTGPDVPEGCINTEDIFPPGTNG